MSSGPKTISSSGVDEPQPDSEESEWLETLREFTNINCTSHNTINSDQIEESIDDIFISYQDSTTRKYLRDLYRKEKHSLFIDLNLDENNSTLTDRILAVCSRTVSVVPKPGGVAILCSDLSRKGLNNIEILRHHKYITFLNLSRNYLTQVSVLNYLPFLEYLDLSHNLLTNLLDFAPPINLKYVNYSYNLIETINDVRDFWGLECLNASHNLIRKIKGIKNLKFLKYLNLSSNSLTSLEGLTELNIFTLCLDNNQINSCSMDMQTLRNCRTLSISNNGMKSLEMFQYMPHLETLNVSNNDICHIVELTNFIDVNHLSKVDLRGNSIRNYKLYREVMMHCVRGLDILDGEKVDALEKARANYRFDTNDNFKAGLESSILNILVFNSETKVNYDQVIPCFHSAVPIIVMVGPTASRKKIFCKTYMKLYPESRLILGVCHTTRPKFGHEIDGYDYYFVTETKFQELLGKGKFITCVQKYGHKFGISEDELRKVKNGETVIFTTDLNAGLQLKSRYHNCKLIFAMPKSERLHDKWLYQHFQINPWISTNVSAYVIQYKAMRYETTAEIFEKRDFCMSILEEIINYITKTHERKDFGDEGGGGGTVDDDNISSIRKEALENYKLYAEEEAKGSKSSSKSSKKELFQNTLSNLLKNSTEDDKPKDIITAHTSSGVRNNSTNNQNDQYALSNILSSYAPTAPMSTDADDRDRDRQSQPASYLTINAPPAIATVVTPIQTINNESKRSVQARATTIKNRTSQLNTTSDADINFQTVIFPSISESNITSNNEFVISGTSISSTNSVANNTAASTSNNSLHSSLNLKLGASKQSIDSNTFMLHKDENDSYHDQDTKICMEFFIAEQMKVRDTYVKVFVEHPGLFFKRIYTDERHESLAILKNVVKICTAWRKTEIKECNNFIKKHVNKKLLTARAHEIIKKLA